MDQRLNDSTMLQEISQWSSTYDEWVRNGRNKCKGRSKDLNAELERYPWISPLLGNVGWNDHIYLHPHHSGIYKALVLTRNHNFHDQISTHALEDICQRLLAEFQGIYECEKAKKLLQQIEVFLKPANQFRPPLPLFSAIVAFWPDLLWISKEVWDNQEFSTFARQGDLAKLQKALDHLKFMRSLAGFGDAFASFEPLLYMRKKYYRDHLSHTLRVAWLMKKLFKEWQSLYFLSARHRFREHLDMCSIHDLDVEALIQSLWTSTIFNTRVSSYGSRNAQVAGLFHDLFLPVEYQGNSTPGTWQAKALEELAKSRIPFLEAKRLRRDLRHCIREIKFQADKDQIRRPFDSITQTYAKRDLVPGLHDILTKCHLDHGVLCGTMLEEFPYEARQAIALHNLFKEERTFQVSFEDYPIAYMLILCDEAQEWGRQLEKKDGSFVVPVNEIEVGISECEFRVKVDFSQKREQYAKNQLRTRFNFNILRDEKFENLKRLEWPRRFGGMQIVFEMVERADRIWIIRYDHCGWKMQKKATGRS